MPSQVSIHARRYRRAKPDRREYHRDYWHVSIHARRYRRAKLYWHTRWGTSEIVLIHARRYRRAKRIVAGVARVRPQVSIHARRYRRAKRRAVIVQRPSLIVSIHARRYRRAKRGPADAAGGVYVSFNPRPPIPAGETSSPGGVSSGDIVSIHARRYRRAKHRRSCCRCPQTSRFNPRPPIPAGETWPAKSGLSRLSMFQSTPADTGGRNRVGSSQALQVGVVSIHARRYRRAKRPGLDGANDAARVSIHARRYRRAKQAVARVAVIGAAVSIHARRYRRAKPGNSELSTVTGWFQSTPADTGGRNYRAGAGWDPSACFNPRPPIPAGETETFGFCRAIGVFHVSIHARRYRRAKPRLRQPTHPAARVSIHARRYRRAKHLAAASAANEQLVSIHARRYRRAKRRSLPASRRRRCFNPRPPIPAGETANVLAAQVRMSQFQSTPADTGGRNAGDAAGGDDRQPVSIHARRYRRAKPASAPRSALLCRCFNPRPPIPAGETRRRPERQRGRAVSIHARRYRRAKPHISRRPTRIAAFQSTPADTGGRNRTSRVTSMSHTGFQSTPADTGGRNAHQAGHRHAGCGVSIHARRYRRAKPVSKLRVTCSSEFQSTPTDTGGRNR